MLMQGLPALIERELDVFGSAIGELQRIIGDYFAPAQGARFTSARVAEVLAWLENEGCAGVGQSSWGPTGFAIVGSEVRAQALAHAARSRWGDAGELHFMVCRARNRGGEVEVIEAARAAAR
jgi:predicted sugar kinase